MRSRCVSAWFRFSGFPVSCDVDDPAEPRFASCRLRHARQADRVMRGERKKENKRGTATREPRTRNRQNLGNKWTPTFFFFSLSDRSSRGFLFLFRSIIVVTVDWIENALSDTLWKKSNNYPCYDTVIFSVFVLVMDNFYFFLLSRDSRDQPDTNFYFTKATWLDSIGEVR